MALYVAVIDLLIQPIRAPQSQYNDLCFLDLNLGGVIARVINQKVLFLVKQQEKFLTFPESNILRLSKL